MKNFRNVTIKCEADKLDNLLDLLDVDYVEEIIISRTPQEFNHDYQTSIGLLDEDEEFELDGIEIKLDEDDEFKLDDFEDEDFEDLGIEIKLHEDDDLDFEDDDDSEWNFIWDN